MSTSIISGNKNSFKKFTFLKGITLNNKNELIGKNDFTFRSPKLKKTSFIPLSTSQKINSSIHLIKAGRFELIPDFDNGNTKDNLIKNPYINNCIKKNISQLYKITKNLNDINNNTSYSLNNTYKSIMHNTRVASKKKEIIQLLTDRNVTNTSTKKNNCNTFRKMIKNYSDKGNIIKKRILSIGKDYNDNSRKLANMKKILFSSKTEYLFKNTINNQSPKIKLGNLKEKNNREFERSVLELEKLNFYK